MTGLSVRTLSHSYGDRAVLDAVSLTARSGRVLGLVGPNGSGKTTLLRSLYAALRPSHGSVAVDGRPVADLPDRERARRLAVVAQEDGGPTAGTVADTALLGRMPHRGSLASYTADDHRTAATALRRVGMRELADRPLHQLSGGERQRALIARAIAQEADYLLLDEPTNHLDVRYQHALLGLVRDLTCTTVVVLHDLDLAAAYCDDVAVLDAGHLVAHGPAEEVLVPAVLEPVYGVAVHVVEHAGRRHLLLSPSHPEVEVPRSEARAQGPRDPASRRAT